MRATFPEDSPLHAFSEAEVQAIFAAGSLRMCVAGEAILSEGEAGDSMYFLINGKAEARLHTGTTVRTYGPGAYFGELSFINPGHKRSATIVAVTDTWLQCRERGQPRDRRLILGCQRATTPDAPAPRRAHRSYRLGCEQGRRN